MTIEKGDLFYFKNSMNGQRGIIIITGRKEFDPEDEVGRQLVVPRTPAFTYRFLETGVLDWHYSSFILSNSKKIG